MLHLNRWGKVIAIEKKTKKIEIEVIPEGLSVPVRAVFNISDGAGESNAEPISNEETIKTIHL